MWNSNCSCRGGRESHVVAATLCDRTFHAILLLPCMRGLPVGLPRLQAYGNEREEPADQRLLNTATSCTTWSVRVCCMWQQESGHGTQPAKRRRWWAVLQDQPRENGRRDWDKGTWPQLLGPARHVHINHSPRSIQLCYRTPRHKHALVQLQNVLPTMLPGAGCWRQCTARCHVLSRNSRWIRLMQPMPNPGSSVQTDRQPHAMPASEYAQHACPAGAVLVQVSRKHHAQYSMSRSTYVMRVP